MSRRIKVLLDTSVLIDILSATPRPSSQASDVILQAIRSGQLEGEISTQSIIDASYILSRLPGFSQERFTERILRLFNYINIDQISSFDTRSALLHPSGDFEDDAQYVFAVSTGCDAVITNDTGFRARPRWKGYPELLFFTPQEFVDKLTS